MKNIESIISGLNQEVSSFEEVQGGEDSSVWKIETKKETLALRILPLHGYKQFCNEKIIMDYVVEYGIPVPAIKSVHKHGEYSVMIMEWANGEHLLNALINQPE
ncbi:MAG TPA: hypothetical protein VEV44_18970, partial [Pseudoneobacillus sp.]|nr:hypothetical protein [Pseudoneobacillus sp.]